MRSIILFFTIYLFGPFASAQEIKKELLGKTLYVKHGDTNKKLLKVTDEKQSDFDYEMTFLKSGKVFYYSVVKEEMYDYNGNYIPLGTVFQDSLATYQFRNSVLELDNSKRAGYSNDTELSKSYFKISKLDDHNYTFAPVPPSQLNKE